MLRHRDILLPATVVGSLPRPSWLRGAVFRETGHSVDYVDMDRRAAFEDAVRLAVRDQQAAGLDIVSDGNLYMESDTPYPASPWVLLNLRLHGFRTEARAGDGTFQADSQPVIRDKIRWVRPVFGDVLRALRRATTRPVKININPGPAALSLWCADEYYGDAENLRADIADAFNAELSWLARNGADVIQIADQSFLWGGGRDLWVPELISRATAGVTAHVTWHMCYGASTGEPRRDLSGSCLEMLADTSLADCCSEIHFETARNGMAEVGYLLPWAQIPGKYVGIGVIDSSSFVVETAAEVADRLRHALAVLPAEKVVVSTDCGLSHLRSDIAFRKIEALTRGVATVRAELGHGRPTGPGSAD
jgi:methionine synthase II (cobalamin-independent)